MARAGGAALGGVEHHRVLAGYQATDRLTSISPNGYDVFGNLAAVYADGHLELYNRSTWRRWAIWATPTTAAKTTAYNSFVKFDPSGQSLWVGYTSAATPTTGSTK